LHVKSSFLSQASLKAVALPSTSCLAIQLALVCTLPSYYHACHDAFLIDGNCYSPTVYIHHRILFASSVSLLALPSHALLHLTLFSALLSLSYWHRWKAVQYFYHSLLTTGLSLATVAFRPPSARHQNAICSLTCAFAR
jgi:hypothetical protein